MVNSCVIINYEFSASDHSTVLLSADRQVVNPSVQISQRICSTNPAQEKQPDISMGDSCSMVQPMRKKWFGKPIKLSQVPARKSPSVGKP